MPLPMRCAIAALLCALAAPFAYSDVIHACVHRSSGNVRFVAADESCRPPESRLHLNTAAGPAAGGPRGVQLFESDGTFTVPAGVTSVLLEIWGGGGAAGLALSSAPSPAPLAGGGGGGGYVRTVVAVNPGQTLAVTVGLGGAPVCGLDGGAGGDTMFGGLAMAGGGRGGTVAGLGGAGGSASAGGISYPGQAGADSSPVAPISSFGLSAQGSFAPPRSGAGMATPGKGGTSTLLAAGICPEVALRFAAGQSGQAIVHW